MAANHDVVREYRAPRYVSRFECIGSACEDACCAGWQVHIDRPHYEKLRDAMARSPAEQDEFERSIEPAPEGQPDPERYAVIRMRPSGQCAFYDEDRLCAVQKRYGPTLLPNGCALYPRHVARVGDRIEVSAALSCPEAARLWP